MKIRTLSFTTCACVALFCSGSLALAQTETPSPSPEGTAATSGYGSSSQTEQALVLGSKIMGCHVQSQQGENLGTISNIIVNANTGHIRYAVVNTHNGKKVTIPWNALNAAPHAAHGETPHFVLNSSKQKLENAPKFNPNDLSSLSNRTMEEPIFTYYDIIWFPDTLTSEELNSRSGQQGANSSTSPSSGMTPMGSPTYGTSPSPSTTPMTDSTYGASPTATASPYPSVSPR